LVETVGLRSMARRAYKEIPMPNYTNSVWSEMTPPSPYVKLGGNISVDVAVIGGGITGVTAARLLKRAGRSVALVDARRLGKGETSKTTAHLTQVLDTRMHTLISRFGVDGADLAIQGQRLALARIQSFVDSLKIDCQFERVDGYLYAETVDGIKTIEAEEEAARRLGLTATLTNEVPLPFPVLRGLHFPEQAQLHPRAYLMALEEGIDGGGSHVFEQTDVLDVEEGEPCRVITDSGVITARDVIVAAHVPISTKLAVHTKLAAYRTYVVGIAMPLPHPIGLFWDTADPYHYIRSADIDGTSYLVVGGEDHKVGVSDDTTLPFKRLEEYVASHFARAVAPTDFRWSGQIIEPADGLPYVGRTSSSGHVYIATGYSGNGITNGTLAALILTDQIQRIPNRWSELFDVNRFKPFASAKAFISENVDFPRHLVAGRLAAAARSGDLDAIPPGEGMVLSVKGTKLAVYRNERGGLNAVSPVCTHLGCFVRWNTTEKSWDCPCHGSRFDPTGRVLNGPATIPLEAKQIPENLDRQPLVTAAE
jgi:glycine/D-amino acid oxidase-like deaminating enzyme/nitrite reductase/ring-hydroxylating ferredoxin subunit